MNIPAEVIQDFQNSHPTAIFMSETAKAVVFKNTEEIPINETPSCQLFGHVFRDGFCPDCGESE